jgi:hypothetical protein
LFLVRFIFAMSIVALLAPEQSGKFMRELMQGVELPATATRQSADTLVNFCRNNAETCRDLVMSSAGLAKNAEKPAARRVTSAQD